ncbi:MAG: hypothetical protein MI867_25765, partial [Pseudomonadales bacterium]|nr:hypothetical protein [Pseudomonadales bacterium]
RYCWEQWGNDEIADEVMKSHLILQKGFNDSTVMGFIAGYKQSRSFAGIAEVEEAEDEVNAIPAVKVGDFIQWESQGVLQFPNPVKIREVNEADGYVFVDGSATGIPIDEVSISEPQTQNINSSAPVSGTPPQTAPPVGANMRQETFTLSDSEILIQFPSTMSEEDFEDLEGWLEIFKRKVKRSISS